MEESHQANLKDTYNKIAVDWVKDHQEGTWWQEGTDHFLSLLQKGVKVLDVGCGGGTKTRYIHAREFRVLGIDFSEGMIEIAKKENPSLEFRVLDMFDIDSLHETFEGIFAQDSLLHIPKIRVLEVLTKMQDRLTSGGYLYISVKGKPAEGADEELVMGNRHGYEYERFFSYFTQEELKVYFEELRLEIVWERREDIKETEWLQIIGKRVR